MCAAATHHTGQHAPATGIPIATINQRYPTQTYMQTTVKVPWTTGLFDCRSNVSICCLTCWCPCITFGRIADIVSQGSTSSRTGAALFVLLGLVTLCTSNRTYSCIYRNRLRTQYILEERPCGDCCIHFWCQSCALCQEYHELENRGFDVPLGWHGNRERQKILGVPLPMPIAPTVETQMRR